jgi:HSP20 family molecular chaperone IbpA
VESSPSRRSAPRRSTERHRTEFRYGALRRAVTLPSTADEDKISARYDNGILEVSVPLRAPGAEARAIPVAKPS